MASEWVIAAGSIVNVSLLLGLIYVTYQYAAETRRIASATREQARASSELAGEAREQRLSQDKPYVLIDLLGYEGGSSTPDMDSSSKEALYDVWPSVLRVELTNVGRGPAMHLHVLVFNPKNVLWKSGTIRYALAGERNQLDLELDPWPLGERETGWPGDKKLSSWYGDEKLLSRSGDLDITVAASYQDIHNREYASYLDLCYEEVEVESSDEFTGEEIEVRSKIVLLAKAHRLVDLEAD